MAVKRDCGKVLKDRNQYMPEKDADLSEGAVAEIIVTKGGTAIDCAEASLAFEDHVTRVHRAVKSKLGRR